MTKQELEAENKILKSQLDSKKFQVEFLSNELINAKTSNSWRLTKPYRSLGDIAKKTLSAAKDSAKFVKKRVLKEASYSWAWKKRRGLKISPLAFGLDKKNFERQRKTVFSQKTKFSLIVAICNPSTKELQETIASVLLQTFENWELCLADISNNQRVQQICEKIQKQDSRVKYKRFSQSTKKADALNEAAKNSAGNYISLLDCGDLLHPSALFETMAAICKSKADFIYTDEAVFKSPNLRNIVSTNFKPDFSPDYFNSMNYIHRFSTFTKKLFKEVGGFDINYKDAQDYDLFFRIFEKTNKIAHIAKCLYYCRSAKKNLAKPANNEDEKTAIKNHFARTKTNASVLDGKAPKTYKIEYKLEDKPLVSILIPSCDHSQTLKKCVDSIEKLSTYKKYEIIIIENNSKESETFSYYNSLKADRKIKIVKWPGKFNYSAINNFGAKYAKGEYILLLNNDIEVITPSWLEEMLMFAQRKDVGGVGAMLYYPSDKIQHSGVILGVRGLADHSHKFFPRGSLGYANRLSVAQDLTCVTAACLMIPTKVFKQVEGLDESFEVAFNDIDLCMRIRKAGRLIVWTPFAELYHYESESRGKEDTPQKEARFNCEIKRFQERWKSELLAGDPYYNPNLTLASSDFCITGDIFPCANFSYALS